jgi:hypothetical protein
VTGRPRAAGPKPLPAGLVLPDLPCAVCKGSPAPWFPATGKSPAAGKAACRACPARPGCLEWALAKGEQLGTWGGTTPADEDTGMTPHFASTSQAAQELAQNWGWHRESRGEWPKDDVLLCPRCAAPPASARTAPARHGKEAGPWLG